MPNSPRSAYSDFEPPQHHMLGPASLGWGLIGASRVASAYMIGAIRNQEPVAGDSPSSPTTGSWVVGVFSHDEGRARRFADEHLIPHTFVNLAQLLNCKEIQCVYVSSHPRHHAQAALAALAAGKHVLCEAPIALDVDEAMTVAHTARSRNLVYGVNFQHRADPALCVLREMLAEGVIGDLLGGRLDNTRLLETSMHTWRLRGNGGGVILNHMMHDIDTLRFLLRDEVHSVQARSTQQVLGRAVEEDVVAHVTMRRSGLVFQLHDSFVLPHVPTSIRLFGSTGTLIARHCFVNDRPSELILHRNGHDSRISLDDLQPHRQAVRTFHMAVREQSPPLAAGTDGVHSLLVALAARESIRRGHTVMVDPIARPMADRSLT